MPSITPLLRPRPRLVSETPQPSPINAFAILNAETKLRLADISALTARLNRGLSGPYSTTASVEAATFHANELADAAHALAKALGR